MNNTLSHDEICRMIKDIRENIKTLTNQTSKLCYEENMLLWTAYNALGCVFNRQLEKAIRQKERIEK